MKLKLLCGFLVCIAIAAQMPVAIVGNTQHVVSSATPTMIQWVSGSNTKGNAMGTTLNTCPNNTTCLFLPNLSLSGNALVSCVTYSESPASTPTWSDDQTNTWGTAVIADDTSNAVKLACNTALNIAANTRLIKITFSGASTKVAPYAAEFNNVATSSAVDASSTNFSASGSSTITAGSITPSQSGDLFFQVGMRTQTPLGTGFTVGSQSNITWKLLGADLLDGMAVQWGQYASTSVLNPTFSMASNSGYASVGLALKTATAGNARPSGMRIVGVQNEDITSAIGNTSPIPLQFPTEGNLLIASNGFGAANFNPTGITSSPANTWTSTGATIGSSTTGKSSMYYVENATSSNAMTVSVATTGTGDSPKDGTMLLYDVQGAATSGVFIQRAASGTAASGTGGSQLMFSSLGPGVTDGMTFVNNQNAFNTTNGYSSPSGALLDSQLFGGENIDGGGSFPPSEENGWGHFTFSACSAQQWTTTFSGTTNGSVALQVAFFKSAIGSDCARGIDSLTMTNINPLTNTVWDTGSGASTEMKIVSNQMVPTNLSQDGGVYYFPMTAWPDDQWAQVTIATISGGSSSGGNGPGLLLRGSRSAITCYRIVINAAATNNTEIGRIVAGSYTKIGSSGTASGGWANGDVLYAQVTGQGTSTTLTVKRGGSGGTTILNAVVDNSASAVNSGVPGLGYSSTVTSAAMTTFSAGKI